MSRYDKASRKIISFWTCCCLLKHFILNGGDGDGYQNCLHGYVEGASSSAKDRSAASVVTSQTNIYL